jgi:Rrf2 family protein
MKLTMSSEMGIHAVWLLAATGGDRPLLSRTIAETLRVSETYLTKVLKKLVEARILASRKGRTGGYVLKKRAEEISLAAIVEACEGGGDLFECIREDRGCQTAIQDCPVRGALRRAQQAMREVLTEQTIAGLLSCTWPVRQEELFGCCHAPDMVSDEEDADTSPTQGGSP